MCNLRSSFSFPSYYMTLSLTLSVGLQLELDLLVLGIPDIEARVRY